ncbi:MAG: hypothetical protein ACR2JB_08895 [Bryobacteraceae bacterium]
MAERWCAVTVRDERGTAHTIEVLARSTHHAASLFLGQARAKLPGQNLPFPTEKTIFEVRLIGEQRVYRVPGGRVQQWANVIHGYRRNENGSASVRCHPNACRTA